MLTAVSSTAACRTAKSRCRIASIISLPMPGQPKMASTTTAPLIRPTARSPATVSAGAAALRSAWWVTTRKSLAPLLRASRTYGRGQRGNHCAADDLGEHAERSDHQRGDRQDPGQDAAVDAGGGQHAEQDREEPDAGDGEPEVGDAGGGHGQQAGEPVGQRVGPVGGPAADDDGADDRQKHCGDGQLQGGGEGPQRHLGGRLAGAQRGAEVEVDDALEVVDELGPHRLVEAVAARRTPRAAPGVADSGRYRLVGSPVSRASRNTPSSTMINGSALVYIRRRTKGNMGWPSWLTGRSWAVGAVSAGVISASRISSPVAELGV